MQKTLLAAAVVAAALIGAPAAFATRPGDAAPNFEARDVDGNLVKLSDFKGKTVVLDWANYQCPFDRMHYESGHIPGLQKTYVADGVIWLTIMSSAPGQQGFFPPTELKSQDARVKNAASHVLPDPTGAIGHLFEAKTTPHIFVIDPKGVVAYEGAIDGTPSTSPSTLAAATPLAENAIKAVMAGQKPSPAATAPYGCSVKYAQ